MDFVTAFVLNSFELRVLALDPGLSPSSLLDLDSRLQTCMELHCPSWMRVNDGFHILARDKVSSFTGFLYN